MDGTDSSVRRLCLEVSLLSQHPDPVSPTGPFELCNDQVYKVCSLFCPFYWYIRAQNLQDARSQRFTHTERGGMEGELRPSYGRRRQTKLQQTTPVSTKVSNWLHNAMRVNFSFGPERCSGDKRLSRRESSRRGGKIKGNYQSMTA